MPNGTKYRQGARETGYESPESKESRMTVFILIGVMLVLIVLGVGALLLLFVVKLPPPSGGHMTPPGPEENVTANLTNATMPACDDRCMLLQAVSTNSPGLCANITNSSMKQQCFVAFSNSSLAICLGLENTTDMTRCVMLHAAEGNDISLCSLLNEPYATSCMASINPCYAKNGTARSICLALDKSNYSLCGTDSECLLAYSEQTGTTGACQRFSERSKQYACMSVALHKNKCADLNQYGESDLCYQILAIRTNDSSYCSVITANSVYAIDCASYFAISQHDYALCDVLGITGSAANARWECFINYTRGTGDVNGCQQIDRLATTSRFKCFFGYAKLWGDPASCDLLNDSSYIESCYIGSIMNNTNLNFQNCPKIQQTRWKNKCYTQSAINMNDTLICDFIDTVNERNSCLDAVKK